MNSIYTSGEYLAKHPTWHAEDSSWKARNICKIIRRNKLSSKNICEVGCGAGDVLLNLQKMVDPNCEFLGWDISPQAIEICKQKANDRLKFTLGDFLDEKGLHFEIILMIDLIEHIENYFKFLRSARSRADHFVFHIPLELSAQSVVRRQRLITSRRGSGHIHYFTRDLSLGTLFQLGYGIIDQFYTATALELKAQ